MTKDAEPFVFTLEDAEMQQITDTEVVGSGGLQTLQRRLKAELEHGRTVSLDDAQLGQLIRYMTRYGSGGFEERLRKAFIRSIYQLFAFEGRF